MHPIYAFNFPSPIKPNGEFNLSVLAYSKVVLFSGGGLAANQGLVVVVKEQRIESMVDVQLMEFDLNP